MHLKIFIIRENPSEALSHSVAFVTEFFLIKKIPTFQSIAFSKAKKISKIIKVLHEESKLAKNIPDPKLQKVVTPLIQVLKEASEIIKIGAKEGLGKTKNALKVIRKDPILLSLENITAKCAELVAVNEKWRIKGLLHVCKGNFRSIERIENGVIQRKGLISGMHTEKAFKYFMKRCSFDL